MDPIRIGGLPKPAAANPANPAKPAPAQGSFQALLNQRLGAGEPVTFTRHAEDRMRARRMELSTEDQGRLAQAVDKAAGKGSRESLVLLDQKAFVVNVATRTVVTAVPAESARDGIFTRIDSAILA